jgi:hypothetical protein
MDYLTLSGWLVAMISLGIAIWQCVSKAFVNKELDAMRSHLRSIEHHLGALHASIVATHEGEDVVKSDAGRRLLVGLAFQLVGLIRHVKEAAGDCLISPSNSTVSNPEATPIPQAPKHDPSAPLASPA